MARHKVYTITEVIRKPSLFSTSLPFDITKDGKVICTVTKPGDAVWRQCENCGENTQNILEFRDDQNKWRELILCDKCADELI